MIPTAVLIAFYILVAVLIGTIVLFIRALFKIQDQIDSLKYVSKFFQDCEKINHDYFEHIADCQMEWAKEFDQHADITKLISEQYGTIMKNQEVMNKCFTEIAEHYGWIIEARRRTNEQYDAIYEEFLHCTEELKHIKVLLETLNLDSPEDPYNMPIQGAEEDKFFDEFTDLLFTGGRKNSKEPPDELA